MRPDSQPNPIAGRMTHPAAVARPRPGRAARRGRRLAATAALVAGLLTLAGCGGGAAPKPSSSAASVSASASVSPSLSPSPSPSVSPSPASSVSSAPSSSSVAPATTSGRPTTSAAKPAAHDPLTGGALSANPVIAVKIDNTHFPQYGIGSADIVYVEQVEGGLTRLIGIFHTVLPTEVGPVRSVRSTDSELLPEYGKPILVYSGGAAAQVARLHTTDVVDASNAAGYHRSSAAPAPYNLHANLQTIAKDFPGRGKVTSIGFTFAANDSRVAAGPAVTSISVTMQAGLTTFTYSGGQYTIAHHGQRYVDADGATVAAQNVIVQHVTDTPDGTVDVAGSPSYLTATVGSGSFTLYRGGHAITGTWSRASATSPTVWNDAHGKAITLQPGRTWIVLAPQSASVSQH